MSAYFIIFLYLRFKGNKKKFNGELMFEYLFLAGLVRFLVEFIRLNPKYYLNLTGAQYISIVMIIIGSYKLWEKRKSISLDSKSNF